MHIRLSRTVFITLLLALLPWAVLASASFVFQNAKQVFGVEAGLSFLVG